LPASFGSEKSGANWPSPSVISMPFFTASRERD
jgi:hypothetical protein